MNNVTVSNHMEDNVGILLHNNCIQLPRPNLKIWGKARTLSTLLGRPSRNKRTFNIIHSQLGLEKVYGKIKKQRYCVKSHHMHDTFTVVI